MYIYILELEEKKYYIGKSDNIILRLENHFENNGSEWTKKYKPINIIEIISNCDIYDEDKYVFKYMNLYGINNVRGGSFVTFELLNEHIITIKHMLQFSNDICYVCNMVGHFGNNCKKKIIINDNINLDNDSKCMRCNRIGHTRELCNYKTFKGGKKINKKKYKKK